MFELEPLRQLLTDTPSIDTLVVDRAPNPSESNVSSEGMSAAAEEQPLPSYDPSVLESQKDFLLELGIPFDEFFCRLIESHGGTLPQQAFLEFTNLSSSTVSRLLQEMEADGQIERVKIGREKIVSVPSSDAPDSAPSPSQRVNIPRP